MHKYDTFKVYNLPLISFQTNTNHNKIYDSKYIPQIFISKLCAVQSIISHYYYPILFLSV